MSAARTILFDLDGTLLDTLDDLMASVNHALALHALPLRSRDEVRRALGNGVVALVRESMPGAADDEALCDSVLADFRCHYAAHSLDRTRPYDGIPALLRECRLRSLNTAIVSNKPDAVVQELRRRFFADTIGLALGEQQPAVRRKPAPDMVLRAMERLGADAATTTYVGDSEVDLATARNAGIPCVAVAWGFRTPGFLAGHGAQTIISHPSELFAALGI